MDRPLFDTEYERNLWLYREAMRQARRDFWAYLPGCLGSLAALTGLVGSCWLVLWLLLNAALWCLRHIF